MAKKQMVAKKFKMFQKIQKNSKNVLNDSKYIIKPLKLNFNAN